MVKKVYASGKLVNQINADFRKKDINAKVAINDGVYVLRVRCDSGYTVEDIYKPENPEQLKHLKGVVNCNSIEELLEYIGVAA